MLFLFIVASSATFAASFSEKAIRHAFIRKVLSIVLIISVVNCCWWCWF